MGRIGIAGIGVETGTRDGGDGEPIRIRTGNPNAFGGRAGGRHRPEICVPVNKGRRLAENEITRPAEDRRKNKKDGNFSQKRLET